MTSYILAAAAIGFALGYVVCTLRGARNQRLFVRGTLVLFDYLTKKIASQPGMTREQMDYWGDILDKEERKLSGH